MSGPSSPSIPQQWGKAQTDYFRSLDPENPPSRVSGHTERVRQWWRRVWERATAQGLDLPWTPAITDVLFADIHVGTDLVPTPLEIIGVGYVPQDGAPAWVAEVAVNVASLYSYSRFFRAARELFDSHGEIYDAMVWQLEAVAEWFLRNYLARNHDQPTDPIVRHFRALYDRQQARRDRRQEQSVPDELDGLVAGNAEPTVGVKHTSSGDAESRFPSGSP